MVFARAFLAISVLVALAAPSAAIEPENPFSRSGPYIGFGGQAGWLDGNDEIKRNYPGPIEEIDPTGGIQVRAGYRIFPWLAAEAMYEWMDNFTIDSSSIGRVSAIESNGIFAAAKFLYPKWRFQPYISLGLGALNVQFEDKSGAFGDEGYWGLAGRPAAGFDFYITDNFLLFGEFGAVLSTADIDLLNNVDDVGYLSAGGGVQFRF